MRASGRHVDDTAGRGWPRTAVPRRHGPGVQRLWPSTRRSPPTDRGRRPPRSGRGRQPRPVPRSTSWSSEALIEPGDCGHVGRDDACRRACPACRSPSDLRDGAGRLVDALDRSRFRPCRPSRGHSDWSAATANKPTKPPVAWKFPSAAWALGRQIPRSGTGPARRTGAVTSRARTPARRAGRANRRARAAGVYVGVL